jgi:hypothetical protein
MTKRPCEELVSRPGLAEGWNDWGYLQDSTQGQQFVSLNYGLEAHLDTPTALYHLAAAGLCEVKGQHLYGQLVAEPVPDFVAEPVSNPVVTAHEPPPPIPQEPAVTLNPGAAVAYGAVVVCIALLAFFSSRRTKANDTTPAPDYPDIFNNQEDYDG